METNTQTQTEAAPTLSWTANAHVQHSRTPRWYIFAGALVIALLLYSIVTSAWTFTIVIILLTGLYAYVYDHEGNQKTITITEHGVQLNNEFTSWNDCTGFWMLQGADYVELHIQRNQRSEITIQTGSVTPLRVREVLSLFIPEFTGRKEGILDMIIRILKI